MSKRRMLGAVAVMGVLATVFVASAFGSPPLDDKSLTLGGAAEAVPSSKGSRIPGHYIVVLKDRVKSPGAVAGDQTSDLGGRVSIVYRAGLKGYAATLSKDAVDALEEDPRVDYVAPDRKVSVAAQTIPTGITRIDATKNSTLLIDGKDNAQVNADVAVIDTGIYLGHPDLNVVERTNCVPAGEDFETEHAYQQCTDGIGADLHGHGTHVAGTVGALDDNLGVVGTAPGARLWAVRVLNQQGSGTESWILAGVAWVTEHADQIEVANMSLSCECSMAPLEEAIKTSTEAGVVYVVAAGNSSKDAKYFSPAKNPSAITVSALSESDPNSDSLKPASCHAGDAGTLAPFSNYGEAIDAAAPGTCVYSTLPDDQYGFQHGTSMAAPHVSGAAAILASEDNPENLGDVQAIGQQIEEKGSFDWEDDSGDGVEEPLLDIGDAGTFAIDSLPFTRLPEIVSEDEVTLRGAVNPAGSKTTYHFEYGTTTEYGSNLPISGEVIGSGNEYVEVDETLENLEGETLYHYRVVATSSLGTAHGVDRTFATTPPAVALETPDVRANDADLKASINPKGLPTQYYFEYGATDSYGSKSSAFPVSAGSGTSASKVEGAVGFLTGDKTYHYRLVASNAAGTTRSKDETLKTPTTEWVSQPPAMEDGDERGLTDVSCVSQNDCMAVGWYSDAPNVFKPLSEHWDGEEWSTISVPEPEGLGNSGSFEGVSCASSTWCVAVGWYVDENHHLFVAHWNGTNWSVAASPTVRVGVIYPPDVSCASALSCVLAGTELHDSSPANGFSLVWNGEKWTFEAMPTPENTDWSQLSSVSCATVTYCVAVGTYQTKSFKFQSSGPIAVEWNGAEWTVIQDDVPAPVKGLSSSLYGGVSCAAVDSCTAILLGGMEVEHWDGEDWTLESVPEPIGVDPEKEKVSNLGVSCATVTSCAIVGRHQKYAGSYSTSGFKFAPRGAIWDGDKWSTQSVANRTQEEVPSGVDEMLKEVSCVSPSFCVGVGWRLQGGGNGFVEAITSYQAPGPVSETKSATGLSVDRAKLVASVNPKGSSTSYQFEYGLTKEYGNKVPFSPGSIGSGSGDVEVFEAIEGLSPNTTYHFRVKATNAKGTTYGEDKTFTTKTPSALWAQEGTPLEEEAEVGLTGSFNWSYAGGASIGCDLEADATLAPLGEGEITAFALTNCIGSGAWSGCSVTTTSVTTPWALQARPEDALASGAEWKWVLGGGCYLPQTIRITTGLELTPDNSEAISTFAIATENMVWHWSGGPLSTSASGSVELSAPGEYGLAAVSAPAATTDAATEVGGHSARLNATVNPQGLSTTYQFEYGTTTSYGSKAPASAKAIGSGAKAVSVSKAIAGLSTETTYHYRVVATNLTGTTKGADKTFKIKEPSSEAGIWTLEGSPLEEAQEVELDGYTSLFDSAAIDSTFRCAVHGLATLSGEGQGEITELEYDTGDCEATGYLDGCTATSVEMLSSPSLRARVEDALIEGFKVLLKLGGSCPLSGTNAKTEAEVVLTPDSQGEIASFELSGDGNLHTALGVLPGQMHGELEVTPAGVYGVE